MVFAVIMCTPTWIYLGFCVQRLCTLQVLCYLHCDSILAMTSGSSILAMILSCPPQRTTMQGMSRIKRPGWATLVLLGLVLLRALVPAGFMLAPVDGRFAVVLCDGNMAAGGHQQHHHHRVRDDGGHHNGVHEDPTCPYAQSAGPAPLPTLPMFAGVAPASPLLALVSFTQTLLRFGPTRQQTPRGPPAVG